MKQKLGMLSLGCPRNLVDAESLLARLKNKGYSITEDISGADIALVNTCAFIDEAKRESVEAILELIELKKEGKLKKIVVCGCLAQRYRHLNRHLPEVDAFVGSPGLDRRTGRFPLTPRHYAYLKICEGCVNSCSYCVIPRIKGKLVSLDEETVIRKARCFNRQKISELNIIGQDITGFGLDSCGESRLSGVLRKIIRNTPDVGWIRLLYLNPERISDDLLDLISSHERVCKYIDLPVQHINDRILRLMNRKATKKGIISLIEKIRKKIPGVCLRTSLIAGFPSETDKEFKELLGFIKEIKFERLGAFTYSREEGTPAYNLKGQLSRRLKEERLGAIMELQQGIAAQVNAGFLNKRLRVLIEDEQDGSYTGRSQADAPEVDGLVYVNSARRLKPGDFTDVMVTDTLEYDLVGEAI
ncbi:MAG: MiaB/RimO family radical SAM methylthiotransferase [Candidatus Omnitrophica bacterium]|nr:MiaB/RimO family radical SAM methylthiotransferase [Candidatus Omnitrophota bacterium]MDD5770673.1 MiaB/RimO family radical SAM methylthiotransferase [Candidatus Omnitrophota bacterium]